MSERNGVEVVGIRDRSGQYGCDDQLAQIMAWILVCFGLW